MTATMTRRKPETKPETSPRRATFAKLRSGGWGIRIDWEPGDADVTVGEVVEITRRSDGKVSRVAVTKIVASYDDAWVCEFADVAPSAPPVAEKKSPAAARERTFAPTTEQEKALELFQTGQSLAIAAGAGTGKTSTLVFLAEAATGRVGQYVAFNKAIVEESKTKFPGNVACNTAHSLAYHAVGKQYDGRLKSSRRMKSTELARILRLDPIDVVKFDGERKQLGPAFLAGLVMRSVERFCQSADPEPTWRHVQRVDGLDAPVHAQHGLSRWPVNDELARALEPALKRAWLDLSRFDGALPFRHSHYLKLWQLSGPRIDADFVLFDEAQDASPVMIDIVRQQTHAQVVWVGDSQQQIYSFTGAINALANVPADQRAFLTQSFRFGPAIADVANRCLEDLQAELRLTGFEKIESVVDALDDPSAILCRTNATAVRSVLGFLDTGKRPYLVGGGDEIAKFARGARDLMAGLKTEHPELACFDTWGEVQEYVEQDEQGDDLKLMVKLIDEFGVERILDVLDPKRMVREEHADVVVSTAHKAKGREWDRVQLAGDFKDEMEGEELRLLYVAVTRAKLALDVTMVGYLRDEEPAEAEEATV